MSIDAEQETQAQTKVCTRCKVDKPVTEFFKSRAQKDGLQYVCKTCASEVKKGISVENRNKSLADLSRIDQFLQSKRPPRELTDDEIFGRYILDDNKRPIQINMFERTKSFQNAWGKEVSFRLNQYLITKTPRAFEVMYQLMDSDLVEPADRIKAAQFIIERTMGKTPDVILTGGMGEKPYQGILDNIESGSRESYRQGIESSRLEIESGDQREGVHSYGGSDSEIYDAEIVDDEESSESETSGLGNNGSNGIPESNGLHGISGSDRRVSNGGSDNSTSEDSGTDDDTHARIVEQKNLRTRAKEMAHARAKAKSRRFAARAMGATSLDSLPFLLEYKVITNFNSPDFGKFYLNLIHPKEITEKVLDRVNRSNDPTRQADALERAIAKVAAKIAE